MVAALPALLGGELWRLVVLLATDQRPLDAEVADEMGVGGSIGGGVSARVGVEVARRGRGEGVAGAAAGKDRRRQGRTVR